MDTTSTQSKQVLDKLKGLGIEDAAIYIGMCDNIQVSNNEVFASVAGIEIENSRHAIVENNMVYDNAGGILTFITPGLPIKTTFDVIFRNNFVLRNNHANFGAPGSTVASRNGRNDSVDASVMTLIRARP